MIRCPKCAFEGMVTPVGVTENEKASREELFCVNCGHAWTEEDSLVVEQAWEGWEAYEATIPEVLAPACREHTEGPGWGCVACFRFASNPPPAEETKESNDDRQLAMF